MKNLKISKLLIAVSSSIFLATACSTIATSCSKQNEPMSNVQITITHSGQNLDGQTRYMDLSNFHDFGQVSITSGVDEFDKFVIIDKNTQKEAKWLSISFYQYNPSEAFISLSYQDEVPIGVQNLEFYALDKTGLKSNVVNIKCDNIFVNNDIIYEYSNEDNGLSAYTNNSDVESVTFPDLFNYYDQYTKETSTYYVTSIMKSGFENCKQLSTVSFSNNPSMQTINDYAFKGCDNLSIFSIPSTVTNIGTEILGNSSNLSFINLNWDASQINSIISNNGVDRNWLANLDPSKLTIYVLNDYVNEYKKHADQLGLSGFNITNEITYETSASTIFSGTNISGTVTLRIKDGNIYLKDANSVYGSDITINNSIKLNGMTYNIVGIDDNCFASNTTIYGSISIPNSINTIGSSIFNSSNNLSTINLNWENDQIQTLLESESISQNWLQNISENTIVHVPVGTYSEYDQNKLVLGMQNVIISDEAYFTAPAAEIVQGTYNSRTIKMRFYHDELYINNAQEIYGGEELTIMDEWTIDSRVYPIVGIDEKAFDTAEIRGKIHIPSSITTIGANAFDNCPSDLNSFYLNWGRDDLQKILSDGTIDQSWLGWLNKDTTTIFIPSEDSSLYLDNLSNLGINNCNYQTFEQK